MLFFKEDWGYYPSAVVHSNTKNVSWLKHANLLKKMGIENYACILATIDPRLLDIDPFDPELPLVWQERVIAECYINPWYYFREVARVPPTASANPFQLRAERGNIALFFLTLNNVDVGLTQIRQTGKSLNCFELLDYLLLVKCRNTKIAFMTKDNQLRNDSVDQLKQIRKYLPHYISNYHKLEADNSIEITAKHLNNRLKTMVPGANPEEAVKRGRGFTVPISVIDEPAYCDNIQITYPTLSSSSDAASDEALQAGQPTFKLLPCTAGPRDTVEGSYMYDVYHKAARWREGFMDARNREELHEMIRAQSRSRRLMVYVEMNHRQLGRTDEWLFNKITNSDNQDPDAVDRDYFNRWTVGTGRNPLDKVVRDELSKSKMLPIWTQDEYSPYLVNWYITKEELQDKKNKDIKLIAGMDTSEGLGNDQLTMVILDEETLETVATCSVSEMTNTIKFSNFVCEFMIENPNVILIPERRSTGIVIIDSLLIQLPAAGIDPFKRVYSKAMNETGTINVRLQQLLNKPFNSRSSEDYVAVKDLFGYATSGSGIHSRKNLYELTLPRLANYAASTARDYNLVDEIVGLVAKNGRIDHTSTGDDDHVIAWLLAGWWLSYGNNLSHFGITNPMLKVVSFKERSTAVKETVTDKYKRSGQDKIKEQLSVQIKLLSECSSDLEATVVERRIRYLNSLISHDNKLPSSIEGLMKEASRSRRARLSSRNRIFGR